MNSKTRGSVLKRRAVVAAVAVGALAAGLGVAGMADAATNSHSSAKPTIVLVYGAFEDGSAWQGVTRRLQHDGYPVVVPAVPLRGVASDSAYVESIVDSIKGPVVLAGHSYGGMVVNEVASQRASRTKAQVYVAAFEPRTGESAGQLVAQFPGSLLGPDTTVAQAYPGGTDVYVKAQSYRALFAGDRSASDAAIGAATQRPIDAAALAEPAAHTAPSSIPAYAIVATQDMGIPPAAERFMAKRAGAHTVEIRSAHDVPVSHPDAVAKVIEQAAGSR
jgi:pimeloyl-ACP methyl ester carboxylesterase